MISKVGFSLFVVFMSNTLIKNCQILLQAYQDGKLGYMKMPEDEHPEFEGMTQEQRLCYFTLPMALNYQRNSYKLREAALATYQDTQTCDIFDIQVCAQMPLEELRSKALKYKVALQPNKHIQTRHSIASTISKNRGSLTKLFEASDYDFLKLQQIIQRDYKSWFPYLSGPKIFHYWSLVMQDYGWIQLKHREYIDIAPDTHITQCSVKLGVISEAEAQSLLKEQISDRRRQSLDGSGIAPIDMHPPLWFWSRNWFQFQL